MTHQDLTFLDHCVAASDTLKAAAISAELPRSALDAVSDLRATGELFLTAAWSIVQAGSEDDPEAVSQQRWALLKALEVATSLPGGGAALLARWVEQAKDEPKEEPSARRRVRKPRHEGQA